MLNEKKILTHSNHSFIYNLLHSFQDDHKLYLVFEFVQGGEIFRILRQESYFPNDVALFYASEIALALEYLHNN